jgi:hypothetical protein
MGPLKKPKLHYMEHKYFNRSFANYTFTHQLIPTNHGNPPLHLPKLLLLLLLILYLLLLLLLFIFKKVYSINEGWTSLEF